MITLQVAKGQGPRHVGRRAPTCEIPGSQLSSQLFWVGFPRHKDQNTASCNTTKPRLQHWLQHPLPKGNAAQPVAEFPSIHPIYTHTTHTCHTHTHTAHTPDTTHTHHTHTHTEACMHTCTHYPLFLTVIFRRNFLGQKKRRKKRERQRKKGDQSQCFAFVSYSLWKLNNVMPYLTRCCST